MGLSRTALDSCLLDWTKVKCGFGKNNNTTSGACLEDIEACLSHCGVSDIEIIHNSIDYYTLKYLFQGNTCIRQFLTEEVES